MQNIKKLCLLSAIVFIFFFFAPISFAIPGQLIYNMDSGQQAQPTCPVQPTPSCDEAIAPYKDISEKNMSLYASCQLQNTQLKKTNTSLMKDFVQEKKILSIMELVLTAVVIFSVIIDIVIILLKKKSSPPIIKQE